MHLNFLKRRALKCSRTKKNSLAFAFHSTLKSAHRANLNVPPKNYFRHVSFERERYITHKFFFRICFLRKLDQAEIGSSCRRRRRRIRDTEKFKIWYLDFDQVAEAGNCDREQI